MLRGFLDYFFIGNFMFRYMYTLICLIDSIFSSIKIIYVKYLDGKNFYEKVQKNYRIHRLRQNLKNI